MTIPRVDEDQAAEAMDELRQANPHDAASLDARAEALYQRITATPAAPAGPQWRTRVIASGGVAAAGAIVVVTALTMMGGSSTPEPPGGGDAGGGFATCLAYSEDEVALREVAFRGTLTALDGDRATFAVEEWFRGTGSATITLQVDTSPMSEAYNGFPFTEGESYLVSGDGESAWGCGYTRPATGEDTEAWRTAFGR